MKLFSNFGIFLLFAASETLGQQHESSRTTNVIALYQNFISKLAAKINSTSILHDGCDEGALNTPSPTAVLIENNLVITTPNPNSASSYGETPSPPNQTPSSPNQTPSSPNQTPSSPNQTPSSPNQTPSSPNPRSNPTRSPTTKPTTSPTRSPTPAPTPPVVWAMRGQSLHGLSSERLGMAVDISNNARMIAAGSDGSAGVIRLYELKSGSWSNTLSYNTVNPIFSVSIASSGKKFAFGNTINSNTKGQVLVFFKNSGGSWNRDEKTGDLKGENSFDHFGHAVSITSDGKRIVVGTDGGDYVKVFDAVSSGWVERKKFMGAEKVGFGTAVSMSEDGTKLLVGAPNSEPKGTNSGYAYFYDLISYTLILENKGGLQNGYFGASVTMSADGSRAAVGAYGKDYVRIYRYLDGNYIRVGKTIQFDRGTQFGCSVSFSGDGSRVAIGAKYVKDGGRNNVGVVFIFDVNNNGWNKIDAIGGEASYDQSGTSVALSYDGRNVAIGAVLNDGGGSNSGQIRVYEAGFL